MICKSPPICSPITDPGIPGSVFPQAYGLLTLRGCSAGQTFICGTGATGASAVQCSTVQCSTVECNTVQCSKVQGCQSRGASGYLATGQSNPTALENRSHKEGSASRSPFLSHFQTFMQKRLNKSKSNNYPK